MCVEPPSSPGDLELLCRFGNTINRKNGADRFVTAGGFDPWLADAVADVTYRIQATPDGLRLLAVSPSRTATFLGELILICQHAAEDGTVRRLKSCIHCQWMIYDASKNTSGRWCSMNVCGSRHNARTYRQRHRL